MLPASESFSVRGLSNPAPGKTSGLFLDSSQIYRYSYEAEIELNEADLPQKNKIHTKHADVGKCCENVFDICSLDNCLLIYL